MSQFLESGNHTVRWSLDTERQAELQFYVGRPGDAVELAMKQVVAGLRLFGLDPMVYRGTEERVQL